MIEYNSNFLPFCPVDSESPEGRARLRHFLERALAFRSTRPKRKGRMAIPYDENGMFGAPIFLENVLVVCDYEGHVDQHVLNFCRKFCELYLRTDDGSNTIKFTTKADFPKKDGYRAVLWIKDIEEKLPFEPICEFFGYLNDKPAFILGKAMIESCRGLDMDSPQALARMEMVFQDSVGKE